MYSISVVKAFEAVTTKKSWCCWLIWKYKWKWKYFTFMAKYVGNLISLWIFGPQTSMHSNLQNCFLILKFSTFVEFAWKMFEHFSKSSTQSHYIEVAQGAIFMEQNIWAGWQYWKKIWARLLATFEGGFFMFSWAKKIIFFFKNILFFFF